MKPKTILIILSGLLVVSLIVWFIQSQKAKAAAKAEADKTVANTPANAAAVVESAVVKPITEPNGYPIIYNTFSGQAKQIQSALGVKIDGIIGPQSLAALKKYLPKITERFAFYDASGVAYVLSKINAGKQAAAQQGASFANVGGFIFG